MLRLGIKGPCWEYLGCLKLCHKCLNPASSICFSSTYAHEPSFDKYADAPTASHMEINIAVLVPVI